MNERGHVDTEDGSLAFLKVGDGPAVVMIHGALVTADDMALALFPALSPTRSVYAFDRPGHGGSVQTTTEAGSPWMQARAILAACRRLNLDRPVIVGHSFGATVALCVALSAPDDIAGVVAIAPVCFPEARFEHVLFAPRGVGLPTRVFDVVTLPLLRNAMFLPNLMPDTYRDAFPFAWASTDASMVANGLDSVGQTFGTTRAALAYASCASRVIILGGTGDVVVTNARHGFLAAPMMPHGRFEWVHGAGHMLHHSHTHAVIAAVEAIEESPRP